MFTNRSIYRWVLKRCIKHQLLLVLLITFTIALRVFPLEMQKRIVNVAIAFKDVHRLFIYCGLYLAAVLLAGSLKYAINVLQGYIGQILLHEMRTSLYRHILRLPLTFFRRTPPGMVISTLTSELNIVGEFAGSALAVPLINILTLLAFGGYMFYLDPLLAFLSMAIYPFEVAIIPLLQKKVNRLNRERIDLTRSLSNAVGEAVSGIQEIHGNASYNIEEQKCFEVSRRIFFVRHRINIYKYLIKFSNNLFQSLGPFLLFLVGGYLSINGRFNLGALVAFLSAYEKLYDPWKELMNFFQTYQDTRVRHRRIIDTFDLQPEFKLLPDDREPYNLTGNIEVDNISFEGEGRVQLLDQISLKINAGERFALVGISGSGKSTLAMVLGQLYKYTSGHVSIDGWELKELTKLDISRNVGFVAQYPFIFDGSIRENLLYACRALAEATGKDKAEELVNKEKLLDIIEQVGLTDDILRIALNTVITEDQHPRLRKDIVRIRRLFHQQWGPELQEFVEFFDQETFLEHSNIATNIIFGYPNRPDTELDRLPRYSAFLDFLEQNHLIEPLLELGMHTARQTVSLLKDLKGETFLFKLSPIPQEQIERYHEIVNRLDKYGDAAMTGEDRQALLELALRFIPAQHKMAALPQQLKERILRARQQFQQIFAEKDPDAFTFYQSADYLFGRTLTENIFFGSLHADADSTMDEIMKRVIDLLRKESLFDEILELGLEFQVGSKGDRLSGGQKQRIALARVFLKDPKVLILDEVTASLDVASQSRVLHYLSSTLKGKSTIIAVVHRLETVRDFDKIAVMKAGKIVEMGHYDELIKQKGLFYELAHGQ